MGGLRRDGLEMRGEILRLRDVRKTKRSMGRSEYDASVISSDWRLSRFVSGDLKL